ncbi:MAG: alpha/beta hydrolase [Thermoanaerobaculia bacterium]|nr:alpha/beta hydrolase [Thermoanaerobaculia bacterium]
MSRAQLDLLRHVLGAGQAAAGLPLERVRTNFDKLFARFPTLDGVDVCRSELGGVPCETVDARLDRSRPPETLVVHLHGGGFVAGSSTSHRNLAGRLSRAVDGVVIVPDYRRAPEARYPAQLEDTLAVWKTAMLQHPEQDVSWAVLSGDSAGGGLAVLAAARLRDEAQMQPTRRRASPRQPDALLCLSPWADYAGTTPSLDRFEKVDPLVDRPGLELMASQYLGGRDPWDPDVTPLRADLTGLPPTLIQTGSEETLQDDAKGLAKRLRDHGVTVRLDTWQGMTHAWHLFAGRVDEAEEALHQAGEFVQGLASGQTT